MNKVPGLNSNVFFDPVGLPFSQVSSEVPFDYQNETLSANNNWTARGLRDDNFLFSSGDLVSQWNDLGSDNKDLTQGTNGLQPTYTASLIGTQYGIIKNAGDAYLRCSTSSDWAFLSDGTTDYTMILVFTAGGSGNSAERFLVSSNGYSGNGLLIDITPSGAGSPSKIRFILYEANSIVKYIVMGPYVIDDINCLVIQYDADGNIRTSLLNSLGLIIKSFANVTVATPNTNPLEMNVGNIGDIKKGVGDLQIWKSYKSNTWVTNVLNWLYNYYS